MKKTALVIALVGLLGASDPLVARPVKGGKQIQSYEEQLAAYLVYPDVLKDRNLAGIVVIQFQLNADSRLSGLEVFCVDEQLKASLTRQLNNRKLAVADNEFRKTYTVRLHFSASK